VIRQAISCDICGTEKRQTNHWFVAYEQAGELRVSAWGAQKRRSSTKHLCGQTCLHKLVDDFMARSVATRVHAVAGADSNEEALSAETGLRAKAALDEFESRAGLATPTPRAVLPLVEFPASEAREGVQPAPALLEPHYASRSWHAEAWERERAREMRAAAHHPDLARRRSSA
jgi:hypothetical protein